LWIVGAFSFAPQRALPQNVSSHNGERRAVL